MSGFFNLYLRSIITFKYLFMKNFILLAVFCLSLTACVNLEDDFENVTNPKLLNVKAETTNPDNQEPHDLEGQDPKDIVPPRR